MIEIKIPKEINQYEAKAAGPFTLRQLLCLFVCLPIGIAIFILSKPYVGVDFAGFLVFIPGTAAYLFGWYKPYGMPFEMYMKTVFVNSFLAPSRRVYKTKNFYSQLLQEIQKEDFSATDSEGKTAKKSSRSRAKKYKRSKEAIK